MPSLSAKFVFFCYPLDSSQKQDLIWGCFVCSCFHNMFSFVLNFSWYYIFIALEVVGISGTQSIYKKNHHWVGFDLRNGLSIGRKHLLKPNGASICCSFSTDKDPLLPSTQQLTDARLIYSVSAALGHNKVFTCSIWLLLSLSILNPFVQIF